MENHLLFQSVVMQGKRLGEKQKLWPETALARFEVAMMLLVSYKETKLIQELGGQLPEDYAARLVEELEELMDANFEEHGLLTRGMVLTLTTMAYVEEMDLIREAIITHIHVTYIVALQEFMSLFSEDHRELQPDGSVKCLLSQTNEKDNPPNRAFLEN